MHTKMNAKSLAVAFSALLSLAAFAPQAQARDHRHDNDRRERSEHRDRRRSDGDHHRSHDRYRSSRENHHHDSGRRNDDRRRDHHNRRDAVISLIFGH